MNKLPTRHSFLKPQAHPCAKKLCWSQRDSYLVESENGVDTQTTFKQGALSSSDMIALREFPRHLPSVNRNARLLDCWLKGFFISHYAQDVSIHAWGSLVYTHRGHWGSLQFTEIPCAGANFGGKHRQRGHFSRPLKREGWGQRAGHSSRFSGPANVMSSGN